MTIEYWRLYNTYVFLAHKYGINKNNFIGNIFWIENVLAKHKDFHILGKKELMKSNPETQMLIINATESSVERIKKKKKCYSGKKKQCTIKSQIIANVETKKIISTNFNQDHTLIPIKKNKNKRLSKEEKGHNHDLSKIRVKIEYICLIKKI